MSELPAGIAQNLHLPPYPVWMLDLRQLTVLRAIASEGSLAAAARKLHFGQPTVTHHLTSLESHLGVQIVVRGPRGASLTPAGTQFLATADEVLTMLDTAVDEVRSTAARLPLKVGTFRTAGALLLAPVIASARREGFIRSGVELVHGTLTDHLAHVRSGLSDCAVVYSFDELDADSPAGLETFRLALDEYRVVVHRDNPLSERVGPIDLADLRDEGWITRDRPNEADDTALRVACQAAGFEPRVSLREDDYSVATAFLATDGVMLLPRIYRQTQANVVDLDIVQPLGGRTIHFVCRVGDCKGEIMRIRDGVGRELRELLSRSSVSGRPVTGLRNGT